MNAKSNNLYQISELGSTSSANSEIKNKHTFSTKI